jgi:predicted ATPase
LLLLDEPETPLSFQNQLALILLIKEAEQKGNQIIIATHSPILIHYPGAEILLLDDQGIKQITLDEVDYLNDIKSFIQEPERFLKHLFE